ncbi:MAG: GNVR domain-containing protein [Acidobacteriota bacterium]|nr:GNVR domain-containing protein [Acidobacteriota bacterium]
MPVQETASRGSFTFHDAWDFLVRRRWIVGGTLFLCWLAAWMLSLLMPSVYKSETTILIEQQKVPEEYVVANVTVDLQQRLEAMKQQILSRTRLQHIIEQYGLYRESYRKNPEETIEQMRKKDIDAHAVESPGKRGDFSAFVISYTAPSAKLAQQVNTELTSLFIDQNVAEQTERAENTTQFLSSELDQARQDLSDQEAKVKQFKVGANGQLPSQTEANVQILNGLQNRQQSLSQELNHAQEQKLYFESMIAQYRSAKVDADKGANSLPAIEDQIAKLRQELADDQTKYTPEHPDVLRLKRLIVRTERQRDEIKARLASSTPAEPSRASLDPATMTPMLQYQSQLKAVEQEVADTRRALQQVEAQIGSYQGRLNSAPIREQQLSDLTRDYDQSKANYDSLLKKQMQSQMATNLSRRQQGEQLRIIDAPSLPKKPISPDRVKLSFMGLLGGLVLGLGLAFATELMEDRVRTEDDITNIVKVRILAGVPHLFTPEEERQRRTRRIFECCCASAMLLVLVAANVYTALGR